MSRPILCQPSTSLPISCSIFGPIPGSDVPYAPAIRTCFERMGILCEDLPLLQLVIIVSSVNFSQQSGSGSITLDCKKSAPREGKREIVIYHNRRQHCCCCSGLNWMLNGMLLIGICRDNWTRPQPTCCRVLCFCPLQSVGQTRGYATSIPCGGL